MGIPWVDVTPGDVVHLAGVDAGSLRQLPASAPAVVLWRPSGWTDVRSILAELERHAIALYPAWLPGADAMSGAGTTTVAAIRSLALEHATCTGQYGPFLADLAEQAVTGPRSAAPFPEPVRALGLARVIAAATGRAATALALELSPGMSAAAEDAMVSACERVAAYGQFAVWLLGAAPRSARVRTVTVELPVRAEVNAGAYWPPRAGQPHPGSAIEQALEAFLCSRAWAVGRAWNQQFQVHALANPIYPDLMWAEDFVVVEIDGNEHLEPEHYAADRRRDVDLQLAGYAVLRFPNAEIEHDVGAVAARIERMLWIRRALKREDRERDNGRRPEGE